MNLRRKAIAFVRNRTPRFYFMHSRPGVPSAYAISVACSHSRFGARQSALCFYFGIRWAIKPLYYWRSAGRRHCVRVGT